MNTIVDMNLDRDPINEAVWKSAYPEVYPSGLFAKASLGVRRAARKFEGGQLATTLAE